MKTESTKQKILVWLLSGRSLTTIDAWQRFGTSELRTYVAALRKEYNITDTRIKVACGNGHMANVKRYCLYLIPTIIMKLETEK